MHTFAAAVLSLLFLSACGSAGAALDAANDCASAEIWVQADGRDVVNVTLDEHARTLVTDTGLAGETRLQVTARIGNDWHGWGGTVDVGPVLAMQLDCASGEPLIRVR